MILKNKLPIPYLLFISLLIFIISVFFAVLCVESKSDDNRYTTETTAVVSIKETTEISNAKETTISKPATTSPKPTQAQTAKNEITTTKKQNQIATSENSTSNTYFTKSDVELVAKILYEECRGVSSDTQKACVAWVICNRVDKGMGASIQAVAKAKNQFDYNPYAPVKQDLYNLALDVLTRWEREKNGESNVGRVLPKEYIYFHGDGVRNYFRNSFKKPYSIWNYTLSSPYKT